MVVMVLAMQFCTQFQMSLAFVMELEIHIVNMLMEANAETVKTTW